NLGISKPKPYFPRSKLQTGTTVYAFGPLLSVPAAKQIEVLSLGVYAHCHLKYTKSAPFICTHCDATQLVEYQQSFPLYPLSSVVISSDVVVHFYTVICSL
ncbi:hypothetical protein P7M35_24835, partial [Vibrio parahaemolyticus]|nr:hypothetical protein [Vibrio parahaemolyticus]